MSLPSGYKRLEYIQSNGTHMIVTNYTPKSSDEINMVVIPTSVANTGNFWCARGSTTTTNTYSLFALNGTDFRLDWSPSATGTQVKNCVSAGTKYAIHAKNGVLTVNDSKISTISSSAFTAGGPISLFASYVNGTRNDVMNYLSAKLFSFSVKNSSGVIVLDLVPCKRNSDNAVGMYDLVSNTFYGNAGTGTFIAGPYAVPEMPERLTASVNGSFVTLTWSASNDATGYKISRNGVQIADQTALSFTDTVDQGQTYVYTVVAYNGNGDSEPAKLTVQTPPGAPTTLYQTMAVRLAWSSVSSAERYNIYRNGKLLGTTTGLFYVDDTADENTEYTYSVSAVNSTGESSKTTITVYTKSGYFLYKPYVESATFQ